MRCGRLDRFLFRPCPFFFLFIQNVQRQVSRELSDTRFGNRATTRCRAPPTRRSHARRRYENNNFYVFMFMLYSRVCDCMLLYSACAPISCTIIGTLGDYYFIFLFNVLQKTCSHTRFYSHFQRLFLYTSIHNLNYEFQNRASRIKTFREKNLLNKVKISTDLLGCHDWPKNRKS